MKNAIRSIASLICPPLAAVSLMILLPHAAHAGDAASPTGAAGPAAPAAQEVTGGGAGPRAEGLQEVVVTATRREEELSRVPISVTALTQDALDTRGIRDFRDMVRFT